MDYKELIKRICKESISLEAYNSHSLSIVLQDAVTAIETLLAERDEMIKDLRHGGCKVCTFATFAYSDEPCCKCKETGSTTDKWEWRGVTKEKKE